MRYKHIVFDVDGTLINSADALLRALQDTVAQIKKEVVDLEDLKFSFGITGADALQQLGIFDTDQAIPIWDFHYEKYNHTIQTFDGMKEVLMELREAGCVLGIITSRNRQGYEKEFLSMGLADYFSYTVCAEDTLKHKPEPEPLLKYMEIANVKSEDILYIGDSIYDMECALKAKTDCALALWGCIAKKHIQATYYIAKPEDIGKICRPKDSWLRT